MMILIIKLLMQENYENKIVKVIVRKKTDTKKFEKFIDKLYNSNVAEIKVVENFDFHGWYERF